MDSKQLHQSYLDAFFTQVDAALSETETLRVSVERLNIQLAQATATNTLLTERVTSLQQEITALKQRIAELESEKPDVSVPVGYEPFYSVDFKSGGLTSLPAPWVARVGKTNNAAYFRPQNVSVVPGVGLVLLGERASDTAQIYSGAVHAKIALPQHFHLRFIMRNENFGKGLWPSFWARPQSGGQGELDFMEAFGGHIGNVPPAPSRIIGATCIVTGTETYALGRATSDFKLPSEQWAQTHVYESRKVPNALHSWVDGVQKDTITNTTGNVDAYWNAQFEDDKTWYLRSDFQIGDDPDGSPKGEAGPLPAGWRAAKSIIERVDVFIPLTS